MDGQALRRWRTSHGIGVRQLARMLDVDPSTVVRWERGDRRPPGRLLERALADIERIVPSRAVPPALSGKEILDTFDALHAHLVAIGWQGEDAADALEAVREERMRELTGWLE